jgi:hypothetical protein
MTMRMSSVMAICLLLSKNAVQVMGTCVTINTAAPVNTISPTFTGFGWEMGQMMGFLDDMRDPVFVAASSHLAPSLVRVGGISADFFRYTGLPTTNSSDDRGKSIAFTPQEMAALS